MNSRIEHTLSKNTAKLHVRDQRCHDSHHNVNIEIAIQELVSMYKPLALCYNYNIL